MNNRAHSYQTNLSGAATSNVLLWVLGVLVLVLSACAMAPAAPPATSEETTTESAPLPNMSNAEVRKSESRGVAALPAEEGAEDSSDGESAESSRPLATAGGVDEAASEGSASERETMADTTASSDYDVAPAAESHPADRSNRFEPVTVGVVNDNEQWEEYLDYLERNRRLYVNQRDVYERYTIRVWDEAAQPVHDAYVEVEVNGQTLFAGRTDAGGQLYFHPLAVEGADRMLRSGQGSRNGQPVFDVTVEAGGERVVQSFARDENDTWVIEVDNPYRSSVAQLDLLFVVDATGSMDDEIAKLKASMADIADEIDALPERPDVRYGLVHYRDRGDSYIVRKSDFTHNLDSFQRDLNSLRAEGGGDTPESVNEALYEAVYEMDWRDSARDGETVRLMVLVGDAAPHLDYGEYYTYDVNMIEAVARGIKIFPVGASGLEADGEYIFRQLAQFTGGKFVFLTYENGSDPSSGPGTETERDVENYSVDTLDRLVVRLVQDELAKLVLVEPGAQSAYPAPQQQASCRGITFALLEQNGPFALVGPHHDTDTRNGNADCNERLPVLCYSDKALGAPDSLRERFDTYSVWSGGEVRATDAVEGYRLRSLAAADRICQNAFGEEWYMAHVDIGDMGENWWAFGELPARTQFWIASSTTGANPWDSR